MNQRLSPARLRSASARRAARTQPHGASRRVASGRLAAIVAVAAAVGSACGTTAETTSGADLPVVDDASLDTPTTPNSTDDFDATPATAPSSEVANTHASASTSTERNAATGDTMPGTAPVDESDAENGDTDNADTGDAEANGADTGDVEDGDGDGGAGSEGEAADCGEFGPIPPVPDSMPTEMYDTDGDGTADDEVTAYGAGVWLLRVVENGVISEATMPDIAGWAHISNDYPVDGRDFIEVTDKDLGTIYTFATVDGCVELLDTRQPVDDLAPTPSPAPIPPAPTPDPDTTPDGPSDITAAPSSCGDFGDGPPLAGIASEVFVDLDNDGDVDDHVITYGGTDNWKLRATVGGVVSEVDITGVGPGWARVLGLADVAELTPGDEIIATVGAAASEALIGVFGLDSSDCLFRFVGFDDTPLTMYAGSSIGYGSQFFCGPGYIGQAAWSLEDDGSYFMSDYAVIESTPGKYTYMPASDGFFEGLPAADLPTESINCNGLTL